MLYCCFGAWLPVCLVQISTELLLQPEIEVPPKAFGLPELGRSGYAAHRTCWKLRHRLNQNRWRGRDVMQHNVKRMYLMESRGYTIVDKICPQRERRTYRYLAKPLQNKCCQCKFLHHGYVETLHFCRFKLCFNTKTTWPGVRERLCDCNLRADLQSFILALSPPVCLLNDHSECVRTRLCWSEILVSCVPRPTIFIIKTLSDKVSSWSISYILGKVDIPSEVSSAKCQDLLSYVCRDPVMYVH